MKEVWKDILGYEGYYRVSDHGNVRSLDRVVNRMSRSKVCIDGKSMRPSTNKSGYKRVVLRCRSCRKRYFVHQLVLLVFVGPCPEGMEVRYLDGNSGNNRLENLKYGTPKENQEDIRKHGRRPDGDKHPNSKLTQDMVNEVREQWMGQFSSGITQKELADIYGVSQGTISKILKG